MKVLWFFGSIPAAIAFWFGAQSGTPAAPAAQEPSEPAVEDVRVDAVVVQDEGGRPLHVRTKPGRTIRTEIHSAGGPSVAVAGEGQAFSFTTPTVAALAPVAAIPAVNTTTAAAVAMHGNVETRVIALDDETQKAFAKLKKAKTDEEREAARDELRDALNSQYEKYLERQEKELKKMAAKLEDLKSQLEKRREAQDDLVELRLKTLENDASGLGWPGAERAADHMIWRSLAPVPAGVPAPPAAPNPLTEFRGPVRAWGSFNGTGPARIRTRGDGEAKTIVVERADGEPGTMILSVAGEPDSEGGLAQVETVEVVGEAATEEIGEAVEAVAAAEAEAAAETDEADETEKANDDDDDDDDDKESRPRARRRK